MIKYKSVKYSERRDSDEGVWNNENLTVFFIFLFIFYFFDNNTPLCFLYGKIKMQHFKNALQMQSVIHL